jgi:thioredoxin 1
MRRMVPERTRTVDPGATAPYLTSHLDRIRERFTPMPAKKVTDASFHDDVIGADKPVLVDFWAEWCGPCRQIGPALEELSEELGEKVTIAKLNIDENPDAPTRYGVRGIPTMILFKGGSPAATAVGARPKSAIKSWLEGELV